MKVKEIPYAEALKTLNASADKLYGAAEALVKAMAQKGNEAGVKAAKAAVRGQARVFARDYRNADSAKKREANADLLS